MTSPANDTSELTAYALGELQAHQATDIHRLLTDCPAATSELEQIEALTDALRQFAPVPQDRLNPEQRHAVLRPVSMPRRVAPMQPRQPMKKPTAFWPVMRTVMKAAAVVTVTGAAYWMGRQADLHGVPTLAEVTANAVTPEVTPPTAPKAELVVHEAPDPITKPAVLVQQVPAVNPAPAPTPMVTELKPIPAPEKAPVVVVSANPEVTKPAVKLVAEPAKAEAVVVSAPKPAVAVPVTMTRTNARLAFVSTGKDETDQVSIRPANFRPLPSKVNAKEMLASPAPVQAPKTTAEGKPRTASEVYIHSWRGDVASCPWNPSTRLLRVTLQVPPNQPAADSASTFPLQVTFDRRYVREFRRLCERHKPAAEMNVSGVQTVWYEFQPVSDEAVRTGRPVATVTLDKARFTTPSVGPFDSSKMGVLDRGTAWSSAREDFLFETAVVGFGMLLKGDHHSPALNHEVVLSLAEKGKGTDADGERTRFIREVNDARRAAGL
ncbi:MAG: YfbK domain-containing protein [Verrucomicrobiota bacterium]